MTFKVFGAIIVILGCGGCGFIIALSYKRESVALKQLVTALDFMQCELQYRMTPLPALCKLTVSVTNGAIQHFFALLAKELEQQVSPNVKTCIEAALSKSKTMPQQTYSILSTMGDTLGLFDLEGQLQALSTIRDMTEKSLKKHTDNQDNRIRSYQTLGLCAGAALAIIFI